MVMVGFIRIFSEHLLYRWVDFDYIFVGGMWYDQTLLVSSERTLKNWDVVPHFSPVSDRIVVS